MKLKIFAIVAALAVAAPVVAEAAPVGALSASNYSTVAAPLTDAAVAPGDSTAKVEKVWWRRGWGWRGRGFGWRGGYGWRGYGWGWRRPYWRRYYW